MPDCACGSAFGAHLEVLLGIQSSYEDIGGGTVNAYFCPGPFAQAVAIAGLPIVATLYSPITALSADQRAAET